MANDKPARALRLAAPRKLVFVEIPDSSPSSNEVVVRVLLSAVSVASAVALFDGNVQRASYPAVFGYEATGVVEHVGSNVKSLRPGARVVVSAGHEDQLIVNADRAIEIPDDISAELALFLIIACDADTGVARTLVDQSGPVVVEGAGVLGLFTLIALRRRGITEVDVVEPQSRRRELAAGFGARRVASPAEADRWPDSTYSAGLLCSDSPNSFRQLQRLVASRGHIGIVADGNEGELPLTHDFHDKELIVIGCSDENRYREFARDFFVFLRETDSDQLFQLYDVRTPLEELPSVVKRLAACDDRPLKVLVSH